LYLDYIICNIDVSRALYYCKACHGYSDDIKIIKKCRCKMSQYLFFDTNNIVAYDFAPML